MAKARKKIYTANNANWLSIRLESSAFVSLMYMQHDSKQSEAWIVNHLLKTADKAALVEAAKLKVEHEAEALRQAITTMTGETGIDPISEVEPA